MEATELGEDDARPEGAPTSLPRFAVVDIETSGLSTRRHRILQVAVVTVCDGSIVDEWSSLIKLRWRYQRIGPRKVHGLGRAELRAAPHQHEVLRELADRLDGAVFTAHNASFDWSFIERAAARAGIGLRPSHRLCTLALSRRLDPARERSHRLADVCERHGIRIVRAHDARYDARATAELLPHLLAEHGVRGADDLAPLYDSR